MHRSLSGFFLFFIITCGLEENYSTGPMEIETYVVGSLFNSVLRSI